jgi:hypothetical protein
MKSINIFISSSERELELEREIAGETVKKLNLQPILFELSPALSNSPYDAFLEEVDRCDIFVMLLWKTFRPAVKAEYHRAIQKNKPILIFTKNLQFDEKREAELDEFLSDFSENRSIKFHYISSWRNFRGMKDLQNKLFDSLSSEIAKFYKDPISTTTREEMYDIGNSIITYSQRRLLIFQRTPTLFLGTKDRMATNAYDAISYQTYEKNFQNTLVNWIDKYSRLPDVTFTYLFDANKTITDLKKYVHGDSREMILERVKENVRRFKKIELDTNYRFSFTTIDRPVSGPFIIGDNRYGIWIMGDDDAISFSQENEKIASILSRMVKSYTQKIKTAEQLIEIFESI